MLTKDDLYDGLRLRMPSEAGTPAEFATVKLFPESGTMEMITKDGSAGVFPVSMYLEHFAETGVEVAPASI